MSDPRPSVRVSRRIEAPAEVIFALLANPAMHPRVDGSGMVREALTPSPFAAVGDVFAMAMHNDEMGPYEMTNTVVDFEPGRRVAWEPVLAKSARPEDQADIGVPAHHVWGFELSPLGPRTTEVTEWFDVSRGPEWLQRATRGGETWREAMTTSLEKLDALATREAREDPAPADLAAG